MRRGNSYSLYLLLCLIGLPVMNQSWTNRSSGISSWTKSKKWAFNVNSHYMKFAGKGRVAIAAPQRRDKCRNRQERQQNQREKGKRGIAYRPRRLLAPAAHESISFTRRCTAA